MFAFFYLYQRLNHLLYCAVRDWLESQRMKLLSATEKASEHQETWCCGSFLAMVNSAFNKTCTNYMYFGYLERNWWVTETTVG